MTVIPKSMFYESSARLLRSYVFTIATPLLKYIFFIFRMAESAFSNSLLSYVYRVTDISYQAKGQRYLTIELLDMKLYVRWISKKGFLSISE